MGDKPHVLLLRECTFYTQPRCTYASAIAIDTTIRDFLARHPDGQILSLGAGFDTTYFRLHAAGVPFRTYFEVDFPDVVERKCAVIMATPDMCAQLTDPTPLACAPGLRAARYRIVGCDLQDVRGLHTKLGEAGIDAACATLVLSECVLTYVPPAHANAVRHACWHSQLLACP